MRPSCWTACGMSIAWGASPKVVTSTLWSWLNMAQTDRASHFAGQGPTQPQSPLLKKISQEACSTSKFWLIKQNIRMAISSACLSGPSHPAIAGSLLGNCSCAGHGSNHSQPWSSSCTSGPAKECLSGITMTIIQELHPEKSTLCPSMTWSEHVEIWQVFDMRTSSGLKAIPNLLVQVSKEPVQIGCTFFWQPCPCCPCMQPAQKPP